MPLVHISKFGHKTIWAVILLTALAGLTDVAADSAVVNNLSILPGYLECESQSNVSLRKNCFITCSCALQNNSVARG